VYLTELVEPCGALPRECLFIYSITSRKRITPSWSSKTCAPHRLRASLMCSTVSTCSSLCFTMDRTSHWTFPFTTTVSPKKRRNTPSPSHFGALNPTKPLGPASSHSLARLASLRTSHAPLTGWNLAVASSSVPGVWTRPSRESAFSVSLLDQGLVRLPVGGGLDRGHSFSPPAVEQP
jgi:hypothetical protein